MTNESQNELNRKVEDLRRATQHYIEMCRVVKEKRAALAEAEEARAEAAQKKGKAEDLVLEEAVKGIDRGDSYYNAISNALAKRPK